MVAYHGGLPTGYFLALRLAPRTITMVAWQLGAVPLILPISIATDAPSWHSIPYAGLASLLTVTEGTQGIEHNMILIRMASEVDVF